MDVAVTSDLIPTTKKFKEQIQTDNEFEKILVNCREVSEYLDINPSFLKKNQLLLKEKKI